MVYPQIIEELINNSGPSPLGPGKPASQSNKLTEAQKLFSTMSGKNYARCCAAALLLRLDDLDGAHDLVNSVHSAEGSYWHGLMHRREPDIHNSNYWFKKVSVHPIFEALRFEAIKHSHKYGLSKSILDSLNAPDWDPYFFNSLCEKSREKNNPLEKFCMDVQEEEWKLLFQYCYENARQ